MPRRMSCSITTQQVRDRTKTVTRRHVDTWKSLKPGDRLTLIEKGMGLPRGSKQVVLAEVEVTSVQVEYLYKVDTADIAREGFPGMAPSDFVALWMRGHGMKWPATGAEFLAIRVRRIEWRYLDDEAPDV